MTAPPPRHRKTESTDPIERAQRLFARAYSRSALPYLVVALLVVVVVTLLGREIEHHLNAIEAFIRQLGPWGVGAFIGLFALAAALLVPNTILGMLAGALFGATWGMTAALIGSTVAALIEYSLARRLLRQRIERILEARPPLVAIQRAVRQDEFRLQVLLRLTPLNPATMSYLLGAAGVRWQGFLIASFAGMPHLALEVYFGWMSHHAARIAVNPERSAHLHDLILFGGLGASAMVIFFVSRAARRALLRAVAETHGTEADEPAGLR